MILEFVMKHPVDRLFGSIFWAVFVTVVVMVLLALVPFGDLDEARALHVVLGIGISAAIVLPRVVLLRTIWHGRDPYILDDEINNMLLGRAIGIFCGAAAGMFVLSKFM